MNRVWGFYSFFGRIDKHVHFIFIPPERTRFNVSNMAVGAFSHTGHGNRFSGIFCFPVAHQESSLFHGARSVRFPTIGSNCKDTIFSHPVSDEGLGYGLSSWTAVETTQTERRGGEGRRDAAQRTHKHSHSRFTTILFLREKVRFLSYWQKLVR